MCLLGTWLVRTRLVRTGLIRTGLIRAGLIRTGLIRTRLIRTRLVRTGLIRTRLIRTRLVRTRLIRAGLIRTGLIRTGLIRTGLIRNWLIRTWLLCLLTLTLGQDLSSCCRGDEDLSCDCSRSGLSKVPLVPDQTQTLDLDYNQITELQEEELQHLQELRTLKLHGNRLWQIHPLAFSALTKLEELDLSDNLLNSIHQSWFNHLGGLQRIQLHQNKYRTLGVPGLFQSLICLQSLSFGGDSLEEVKPSDLKGLGGLKHLHMVADKLQRFGPGALSQIWPLDHVTISLRTPFERDVTLASAVVRDVSRPDTDLTLDHLHLETNASVQPFREIRPKRLRNLSFRNFFLSDEAMVYFLEATDGALVSAVSIQNVTLSGVGRWEKANRTKLPNLQEVFIQDVSLLNNFDFGSFLDLAFILKLLRKVSLINAKVFVMPCPTSVLLKNLVYLDLSQNLLTDLNLRETLCNGAGTMDQLRVLNLSTNALKVSRLVSRLPLSCLDVSSNSFGSMPDVCFWPESLRVLNLSRTTLSGTTSCLPPTLQVLDLSFNKLQSFVLRLQDLKELLLSGNKLLTLPPGPHLPNLHRLHVQKNFLVLFSRSELLSYPRLRLLEAGFNKFHCSCNFVQFFQFVTEGGLNLTLTDSLRSYACDAPLHLRGAPLASVRRSVVECRRVLVVSLSCGLVLVLLFLNALLFWKLHLCWYLRVMWAWLSAKRRRGRMRSHKKDAEEQLLVMFDAFVSYSERDSGWIETYLLPELEQSGSVSSPGSSPSPDSDPGSGTGPVLEPLRLCLHHRDFVPGRWIMDNIVNAIESSRRTLFILSSHFVQSDWCRYELDFAHFRLLEGNCGGDAAILVLLEPLSHDDVPKRFCRLRQLLRSTTYLPWPQDPDLRDQFWTSLREALRRDEGMEREGHLGQDGVDDRGWDGDLGQGDDLGGAGTWDGNLRQDGGPGVGRSPEARGGPGAGRGPGARKTGTWGEEDRDLG